MWRVRLTEEQEKIEKERQRREKVIEGKKRKMKKKIGKREE